MKRKNWLLTLCLAMSMTCSAGALASCSLGSWPSGNSSSSSIMQGDEEIRAVYAQYVSYTQAQGKRPLSYETWLDSIKGKRKCSTAMTLTAAFIKSNQQ